MTIHYNIKAQELGSNFPSPWAYFFKLYSKNLSYSISVGQQLYI